LTHLLGPSSSRRHESMAETAFTTAAPSPLVCQ